MEAPVSNSYVGMTHDELDKAWRDTNAVRGADYTERELQQINRKWRSLGKRIAQGPAVTIKDGPLSGGNKRRQSS